MSDTSLESFFQDFKDRLESRQEKWNIVINKIGTAYEEAYDIHQKNLPTHLPVSNNMPKAIALIVDGTVAWLDWGRWKGAILVPIAAAINLGAGHLAKRPANLLISDPAVDMSPNKYRGSLSHFLNVPFREMEDFIDRCTSQARRDKTRITAEQIVVSFLLAGQSPLWYPPKDWKVWDEQEIQDELERLFWAEWANGLKDKSAVKSWGHYNYAKVVKRLAALDPRNRSVNFEALSRNYLEKDEEGEDMNYGDKVNMGIVIQLIKWAQNYKPLKQLGDPLPLALQMRIVHDMFQPLQPFLQDLNFAARGVVGPLKMIGFL